MPHEDAIIGIQLLRGGLVAELKPDEAETKLMTDGPNALSMRGWALRRDMKLAATVIYHRTNFPAFNRTYKQICNSLRIE